MLTQWDKIKAAERMQAHIETHLGDKITMAALARAARYSQWHAGRVFKEVTGKSPFEYVRLRRLSAAAEELQRTSRKVVDVAFDFVFDSHEGFTRAFARQFGMSPLRFRKTGATVKLFMPPQLRDWYTRRQRGEQSMSENKKPDTVFVQVLERPARKMIVKRGTKATHYFEYCEEVGCDVWDRLAAIPNALQEPLGMWLPASLRPPGTSEYVQGVEVAVDFDGEVPEGFEVAALPACKMMVFQGPPFEDKDFEQAISSLWDVMKSYKPETSGPTTTGRVSSSSPTAIGATSRVAPCEQCSAPSCDREVHYSLFGAVGGRTSETCSRRQRTMRRTKSTGRSRSCGICIAPLDVLNASSSSANASMAAGPG